MTGSRAWRGRVREPAGGEEVMGWQGEGDRQQGVWGVGVVMG